MREGNTCTCTAERRERERERARASANEKVGTEGRKETGQRMERYHSKYPYVVQRQ